MTVAAALKKIAVSLLTDKKALKTVGGIVLGIIILIIMPVVAVVSVLNGTMNIDTDRLRQIVAENMSAEEQARLQAAWDTMYEIEDAMTEAGYGRHQVREAQVLYVLVLSDHADDPGFIDALVGCFAENQTDEQIIAAVNAAFGTEIVAEEFTMLMSSIQPERDQWLDGTEEPSPGMTIFFDWENDGLNGIVDHSATECRRYRRNYCDTGTKR